MTERRRPIRRGRGRTRATGATEGEDNPYRDDVAAADNQNDAPSGRRDRASDAPAPAESGADSGGGGGADSGPAAAGGEGRSEGRQDRGEQRSFEDRGDRPFRNRRGRGRQRRGGNGPQGGPLGRGPREFNNNAPYGGQPSAPLIADLEMRGWFDPQRDAGNVRQAINSYLAAPNDPWVSPALIRQYGLRRGDELEVKAGLDPRGRNVVAEIVSINGIPVDQLPKRPDFQSLIASYPDRRLTLETGSKAKGGHELTRRAIDLIAPIGYGQRALIVAPARAGKTTLLHAITEGVVANHPEAVLLILLVDERPEEVSEFISWGVGEVIASSFDQTAKRHAEVCEMVFERARRLVELGKDVVIVLDSLTRMARAHNTAERGTGRTMSGGLDTSAMAKPKAYFGSARNIAPQHGGGSLTIIATALVETGSRMDDVIFEEFKGTGNCEIKLDRALAEKRIFPAFDVAASGTRREEKLYREDQLDAIYTLRRGLQQMPPTAAMEWLIKRIAATHNNDALLDGL